MVHFALQLSAPLVVPFHLLCNYAVIGAGEMMMMFLKIPPVFF